MESQTKIVDQLEAWDKIIYENEEAFIERFCWGGAMDIVSVSWSAYSIHISHVLDCGQHVGNSFPISDWFSFLNGLKVEKNNLE